MNDNSFDFNINNYNIQDLEKFLNLDYYYTENDIIKKANEFTKKLSSETNGLLKTKLQHFIEEVKDKLISIIDGKPQLNNIDDLNPSSPRNNLISAGSTYIIDNHKDHPTSSNVQQVYSTDIARGSVTALKKKSTVTTFCINSIFRDGNSPSSTDCIYNLPYVLKNVMMMEVMTMEIPQSIFLFSERNESNTIYFKEYSGLEGLVILPPGNYKTDTTPDLITTLETAINDQLGTGTRFVVSIDEASNRITITNTTYMFDMNILHIGTNKNIKKTMGWILGFRKPSYMNQMSYITESIYNNTPANYLYLEINEFNSQQRATDVIGLLNNSFLGSNIIAKLCYTNSTSYTDYNTVVYEGKYIIGSPREYFGPIHLQKMNIRLLDEYGCVVDLNGLDFSFTLKLKVLYDL